MKKLLSVLFIFVLCFSLVACGSTQDEETKPIVNPTTVYISFSDYPDDELEVTGLKPIEKAECIVEENSTVLEATQIYCINNGLDYQLNSDKSYFDSLLGFTAGDFTETTGWIYEVNGEEATVGAGEYVLQEGDAISWQFLDYSQMEQ